MIQKTMTLNTHTSLGTTIRDMSAMPFTNIGRIIIPSYPVSEIKIKKFKANCLQIIGGATSIVPGTVHSFNTLVDVQRAILTDRNNKSFYIAQPGEAIDLPADYYSVQLFLKDYDSRFVGSIITGVIGMNEIEMTGATTPNHWGQLGFEHLPYFAYYKDTANYTYTPDFTMKLFFEIEAEINTKLR